MADMFAALAKNRFVLTENQLVYNPSGTYELVVCLYYENIRVRRLVRRLVKAHSMNE